MQTYTVVFSTSCGENIEDAELPNLVEFVSASYSCDPSDSEVESALCSVSDYYYGAMLLPCCLQEQTDQESVEWKQLEGRGCPTHAETCLKCIREDGVLAKLVEQMHHLADTLPKLGCILDVLWVENKTWPDFDSNLDLYGALKRLREWHHAKIRLVGVEQEVTGVDEWIESTGAEMYSLRDGKMEETVLWRGDIQLRSAQSLKPLSLPGFSMQPYVDAPDIEINTSSRQQAPERLLSPSMELIVPLDLHEIPTFYIASSPRQLVVSSSPCAAIDKSRQFLQLLQQNKQLCYLMRLNYGTTCKDKDDKEKKPSQSWKDAVLNNINAVYDCPHQSELSGETGCYRFLLVAAENNTFLAYPVRELTDIHVQPFHDIVLNDVAGKYNQVGLGGSEEMTSLLRHLPQLSALSLLQIQHNIEKLQTEVLRLWNAEQDADYEMEVSTVNELLCSTRQYYLNQHVLNKLARQKLTTAQPELVELVPPKPEYENQFEQVERLVLGCRGKATDSTASSNESLGGLSPPTRNKVLTLNAEEFLKFFKANGKPRKEAKCVLTMKKNPLCKYDSVEAKTAQWTDYGMATNYHDIYYHRGDVSDKLEEKTARLRSQIHSIETSSTCTIEQANSPASILLKASPLPQQRKTRAIEANVKPAPVVISPEGRARKKVSSVVSRERKKVVRKEEDVTRRRIDLKRNMPSESKRLYMEKKQRLEKEKAAESAQPKEESKTAMHKRMLKETVTAVLAEHELDKGHPLFKKCFQRLYKVTYDFVKDLRKYTNLREEMEKITKLHAQMVVTFEKGQQT